MNNTGQNGEQMRYRVILVLVVALAAFSSAMKELNQIQQLALDANGLIAQWSNKVAPTEVQPAIVKVETCEMKQSAPAVELPWLSESRPAASEEMSANETVEIDPVVISELPLNLLKAKNRKHSVIRISARDREMLLKLNRSINLRIAS